MIKRSLYHYITYICPFNLRVIQKFDNAIDRNVSIDQKKFFAGFAHMGGTNSEK